MKRFVCKAVLNSDTTTDIGLDWAMAKRGILSVDDSYIQMNDLKIPFSEISSAMIRIVPSAFFLPGCILTIKTERGTHHFGLRYSKYWKGTLPFNVARTEVRVPYLWPRRIIAVVILFYMVFRIIESLIESY
jgi:hypothetical protein